MTNRWRTIISSFVIIVEILALLLIIFGLYKGNPVNTICLPIGGVLAMGGIIIIVLVSRQKAR